MVHILHMPWADAEGGLRSALSFLILIGGASVVFKDLDKHILDAAQLRVVKHEQYARTVGEENLRRRLRSTGTPELQEVHRPETWEFSPGFNPYLVRSRYERIAHSISGNIRRNSYSPRRPAGFAVPKPGGGERVISTFEIADEVVSNLLLRSLIRKNISRFSARAYAYRSDLGAHDAIWHVSQEFRREPRLFVAEFDFSKFFDSIHHEYLEQVLDTTASTALEKSLIRSFLRSPQPYLSVEERDADSTPRSRGIPQGTSASLFLANLAASELDRDLERLGVGFVRYADDTLIWSPDYGRICEAASLLHEAADRIGSEINEKKSPGVRILVRSDGANTEMESTDHVDYLGHRVGLRGTSMKPSSVDRIKSRVGQMIYSNLIRELRSGTQAANRLTGIDRDYATLIAQLRRYLYGPLNEAEIESFQSGALAPLSFEGIMAFYPLIDDEAALRLLDGWMAAQIWLAMRKRAQLLADAGLSTPPPHGLTKSELIGFRVSGPTGNGNIDLRIPSVGKIAGVIRSAISVHGFGAVAGKGRWLYIYDD